MLGWGWGVAVGLRVGREIRRGKGLCLVLCSALAQAPARLFSVSRGHLELSGLSTIHAEVLILNDPVLRESS